MIFKKSGFTNGPSWVTLSGMTERIWSYSLQDAIQLTLPWACLLLLTVLIGIYVVLLKTLQKPLYRAGLFVALVGWAYVLLEALMVVYGWTDWEFPGGILHRIENLATLWMAPVLMYLAMTIFSKKGKIYSVVQGMYWAGIWVALGVMFLAFLLPDSFISIGLPANRIIVSPIEFARGTIGPLYTFRDIYLGLFMLFFLVIGVIHLIQNPRDRNFQFFFIGSIFIFYGALDDIIYYQFGFHLFLKSYLFSRVALGISLMVITFIAGILREFVLSQKELASAHETLHRSDEKYRLLSDGAGQAVFSLSEDLRIHQYNKKAKQLFSLYHHKNRSLEGLLQSFGPESSRWVNEMLDEKISELNREKQTSFRTLVKDPRTGETEEYDFQLNSLPGKNREYIGRATRLMQGKFSRFVTTERISLVLDNHILLIDDVTTWMTHVLNHYMSSQEVLQVKMALQEMILNGLEHGNLGISFQDKKTLMSKGTYREFLLKRQNIPPYSERKLFLDYHLEKGLLRYVIGDQGEGFDLQSTLGEIDKQMEENLLSNGRGIRLTMTIFDKVEYNDKGNQVTLEKQLKQK